MQPLLQEEMAELKQDIEEYVNMEKSSRNQDYWKATLIILNESQTQSATAPESRAVTSVADDIDTLLSSKSHDQLLTLEAQVQRKLSSDEPVDVDYWQQLLRSLKIWKARARIRDFHAPFADRPKPPPKPKPAKRAVNPFSPEGFADPDVVHDEMLEDNEAFTAAAHTMFDLETTRIVEEGVESEETFNVEDEEATANQPPPAWATEHRPRKPKFFNRVVMGYEWNKYNQTHYDESNPPPKVVQGYKFNIFYPNLVDVKKAPTYKVERNRQKRRYVGGGGGTSAGEDETCIIRFTAGPPYLDVAFRIIDRDWDYSSRFNRGFKSSFEKVCVPYCGGGEADGLGNLATAFPIQESVLS
jgi:Cactus-binding C-terminus of cactin protein/Conserved mid region of cactin